jgi:hypothetical protein
MDNRYIIKRLGIGAIFILLGIALAMLTGCADKRAVIREKGLDTVNQSLEQNDAIAGSLEAEKPFHAAGIKDNGNTIREVLKVSATSDGAQQLEKLAAESEVRVAALRAKWQDEKAAYEEQVVRNAEAATAAKKEAEQAKWWMKLGAFVVAVAAACRWGAQIGNALGLPLGGPIARVLQFIGGLGDMPDRVKNLKTLVQGADVGVKELQKLELELDEALAGRLGQAVGVATKGRFKSLTDFWKAVARAHTIDAGISVAANLELHKVRDEMKTYEVESVRV